MSAVIADNVVRRFGDFTAVDGVSLQVNTGEVFGIIGPNGAGKTTLLNCIEGLDKPTSGNISVLGRHPINDRRELTFRTGVQLQSASLLPRITVAEAMRLFSSFYSGPVPWLEVLSRLGIAGKQKTRVERLSGGERQRVFIAIALLNRPEVVFLDELTTALDPQARLAMWDVIKEISEDGTTVVLTTHYMEEAESLCDRVGIIDHGNLIALDTVPALVRDYAGDATARLTLSDPLSNEQVLNQLPSVTLVSTNGRQLTVQGTGSFLQDVLAQLTAEDIRVSELTATSPGLEDVFLSLTGRAMRTQEEK